MTRIANSFEVKKWGGSLVLIPGSRFCREVKIVEGDKFIPCVEESKVIKNDEIFGNNELILRYRRRKEVIKELGELILGVPYEE